MKESKSLFNLLNLKQMPLLRALIFTQLSVALFFSISAMLIAVFFINQRSKEIQNLRKIDLVHLMSSDQEKLRIWTSLGMEEASSLALKNVKKIDFIKKIEIKKLTNNEFIQLKDSSDLVILPEKVDENLPFYLILSLESPSKEGFASASLISLLVFVFVLSLIYFSIAFIIKNIFKPLSILITDEADNLEVSPIEDFKARGEMAVLISKIQNSQRLKVALESEKMNFKLATQLAHDIRSPLEMLKGIKDDLALMPEASRRRIQLGINRIEEITFNLLKANKQDSSLGDEVHAQEILGLVISVVTEKKIEYRNRDNIELVDHLGRDSFGLFSKLNRGKLKSIISNIINNASEAIGSNSGIIDIFLEGSGNLNVIRIRDNGQGISPETAKRIFTKGFTTKPTGNGLGLINAKVDIEALGGTLTFESEVGKGSTFIISLPKSEIPASFIDAIHAYNYERIIVLDDDPAFHDVWALRLEGIESKIEHIYSVEEILQRYQVLHPKILLLSDFELMDNDLDGIDVIQKLNHAQHSVLVTARNEELEIQERCLKAGIKLLPKSLVNYIRVNKEISDSSQAQLKSASKVGLSGSIQNSSYSLDNSNSSSTFKFGQIEEREGGESEAYDRKYVTENETRTSDAQDAQNQKPLVVLIDDDKLIRYNWSLYCESKGIPYKDFVSVEAFLEAADSIPRDARIYVDSNLGNDLKGEVESEKIFNLGFKNLYLATGYGKEFIQKPYWIIEVYSKGPEIVEKS